MTYQQFEESPDGGSPVLLVTFTRGGAITRLAASKTDVIAGGDTYAASAVTFPKKISQKARPQQEDLIFTFPLSDSFARAELGHDSEFAQVQIQRTHRNDPDGEVVSLWVGFVQRAEITGERIRVICSTDRYRLDRRGQYRVTQRNCPHALYGEGCNVDISLYQQARDVIAVDGTTVTLSAALLDEDAFQNGVLTWGSEEIGVDAASGVTLTLDRPQPALAEVVALGSVPVLIAPGCAKNTANCQLFDNIANFGGFPFIPERDLLGTAVT